MISYGERRGGEKKMKSGFKGRRGSEEERRKEREEERGDD